MCLFSLTAAGSPPNPPTITPRYRLVSGAGDIKITKDGLVLLNEMVRTLLLSAAAPPAGPHLSLHGLLGLCAPLVVFGGADPSCVICCLHPRLAPQQIQHPTAALIARAATAQVLASLPPYLAT